MADIKKGNGNQKDEIDDFAKALLHKKTEMVLYPEEKKTTKTQETLSKEERASAEESLSSALDLLRLERGQLPIEEEEKRFSEAKEEEKETDLDSFTSSSIHLDPLSNNETLDSIYSSFEEEKTAPKEKTTKPKKVHSKKKTRPSSSKSEKKPKKESKDAKPVKEERPKKKESVKKAEPIEKPVKVKKEHPWIQKLKPYWKGILIFFVIFAALLGGYCYKVLVYDPQNITNAQQEATYKKLVEYADEWSMLSEAEKMELIDLEGDYQNMLAKQKKSINAYFIEQTGQDFDTQLAALKELRQQQEDQTKPEYQQLVAYISNWSTKSDEEKAQILNYRDMYNSLSDALKQQIDAIAIEQSGSSFAALMQAKENADQQAQAAAEEEARKKAEQIAPLQEQIDSLNAQLSEAQAYGQTLIQDQSAGEDLQSAIDMNNETIAYLQAQIADLQSQIQALQ